MQFIVAAQYMFTQASWRHTSMCFDLWSTTSCASISSTQCLTSQSLVPLPLLTVYKLLSKLPVSSVFVKSSFVVAKPALLSILEWVHATVITVSAILIFSLSFFFILNVSFSLLSYDFSLFFVHVFISFLFPIHFPLFSSLFLFISHVFCYILMVFLVFFSYIHFLVAFASFSFSSFFLLYIHSLVAFPSLLFILTYIHSFVVFSFFHSLLHFFFHIFIHLLFFLFLPSFSCYFSFLFPILYSFSCFSFLSFSCCFSFLSLGLFPILSSFSCCFSFLSSFLSFFFDYVHSQLLFLVCLSFTIAFKCVKFAKPPVFILNHFLLFVLPSILTISVLNFLSLLSSFLTDFSFLCCLHYYL